MTRRLDGKVALITGGTSGIGEATVELFAAEGAQVAIVGRNADKGAAMVERLGQCVWFCQADVSREEEVASSIRRTVDRFARIDVLFNNAGGTTSGAADTITHDDYRSALDVLLGSVLFGIRHAAPYMKSQGRGSIINNSSVASFRTHYGGYLYSIAKAGVAHATRLAGMELAPYGIRVNAISPGGIPTPIFFGGSGRAASMDTAHVHATMSKLTRNIARAVPTQVAGDPMDIAKAALFLASDEARHINCHDLVVDGGMSAAGRLEFDPKPQDPA